MILSSGDDDLENFAEALPEPPVPSAPAAPREGPPKDEEIDDLFVDLVEED